jgi:hypothetical protein
VTYRFRDGMIYSGETIYGGCGYVARNFVTIIKRTKGYITYKERYGGIVKTKRKYNIKCEFFDDSVESFYADSLEPSFTR